MCESVVHRNNILNRRSAVAEAERFGTAGTGPCSLGMSDDALPPPPVIRKPLTPKAEDGRVTVVDPPEIAITLTPDAAEISGLRLIAEADEARRKANGGV